MSTKHGPKNQGKKGTAKKVVGKKVARQGKTIAASATTVPDPVVEEPVVEDAPVEAAGATTEPAPKRKRDMTLDELRAEYEALYGHSTDSTDRRYLLWRLSPGGQKRNAAGQPREKRPPRDKADMQVLPLGLLRETTRLLDAAVAASGTKSRSAFIRVALIEKLRAIGGDEAIAAADALAGEFAV